MQKFKKLEGSKSVKVLLIAVLMLSLLIIAVSAAVEDDYTISTSYLSGLDFGVGDDVELAVSFTNNTNQTVNGALIRVTLPTSFLSLVDNSVKIRVNNGGWNQAEAAKTAIVQNSTDYKYSYNSTSGVLLVSLGNIASGQTVTIAHTMHITSDNVQTYNYNFYKNNDVSAALISSNIITMTPVTAEVKPAVEKTSRNTSRSGGKAIVGDIIEYTIKATNATSRPNSLWTGVTVTDVLPDGVTFQSGSLTIEGAYANTSQYSYNTNTRTLTVALDDLGPNASSTVVFRVSINQDAYGKTIANSVVVSGKDREDGNAEKSGGDNDGDGYTVVSAYTITFNKGPDDVQGNMDPQTVVEGTPTPLNECTYTRPGYVFDGWSTSPGSNVVAYKDKDTITATSDTPLYAVWTNNTCTISFDKNATDATGTMNPQEAGKNQTTTLKANAFTRSGYYFRGWSTTSGGEIAYTDGGAITPADNITLYAVWGADPCTITFYKNATDATGTMEAQVTAAKVPAALKKNEFERGGYMFAGWSTNPNSNEIAYADEEVITPVDNMALYAVWSNILLTDDHIAYVNGYPDGSVKADNNITRAEAVTIFFRLIENADKNNNASNAFPDVESGTWYTQAVNYMAKAGVVNGYPDGTFKPGQNITRAEFAKIASRFDNLSTPQGDAFSDVNSTHWAYLYINSAYEKGWVTGYPDGTFQPSRNISRAEVMAIVNRMLSRKIDDAALARITNPYNDINSSHWAYKEVIEASIAHDYESDASNVESWTTW